VERAAGSRLRLVKGPRRPGDPAELVASADKAHKLLGWRATESSLEHIVATALAWRMEQAKPPRRRRRSNAAPLSTAEVASGKRVRTAA
jgi:UDP-glucose 4-epimerase